jgi:hypothetical protein
MLFQKIRRTSRCFEDTFLLVNYFPYHAQFYLPLFPFWSRFGTAYSFIAKVTEVTRRCFRNIASTSSPTIPSSYLKATLTRGEKYGRNSLNKARLIYEHRDNSYHYRSFSPFRRWRRLLVFAAQVKRNSPLGRQSLRSEPTGWRSGHHRFPFRWQFLGFSL